jgi:exopolysaccharide production protein ExoQ
MLSFQLVLQIIAGLGPYFSVAILLAIVVGLFLPWGVMNPQKWLYLYIIGMSLVPFGSNAADASGSLYKQITWGLLYLLCLVILIRSRREINAPEVRFPWELIALYIFTILSIAWSDYKISSFKRYILLIGLLLIATLTVKLSILDKSFSKLLGRPLSFFMLAGVAIAATIPNFAFDTDGALRGFTSHKNTWGQLSLLCSIIFFNNALNRINRKAYLLLLAIALTMLLMSKSATSLLAFCISSFCVLTIHSLTSKKIAGKILALTGFLIGSVLLLIYTILHGELPFDALTELVFKATDKSSTLTGRTQLWQLMGAEIAHHPWLGTGFGGFWQGMEGASGALVQRLNWGPPTQAHSGYIDGFNEIGIFGMLLFGIVVISHIWRCFELYSSGMRDHSMLHISLIIGFLTINYAESSLMQGSNMWWIITTCSIVEVYNRLRTHRSMQSTPMIQTSGIRI